jgi:succinate dehydrogenase / fumarate reductase cytochrome b subunit
VFHIVYAFILTAQNRRARGTQRYDVTARPAKVEWASQNMLVLGLIIVAGLCIHLYNFWYNMMFAELAGVHGMFGAADGFSFIQYTFSQPLFAVIYVVWIAALWFHLSHGFWSAMQTLGIDGKIWFNRWRVIGIVYVSILALGFLLVILSFAFGCAPSLANS